MKIHLKLAACAAALAFAGIAQAQEGTPPAQPAPPPGQAAPPPGGPGGPPRFMDADTDGDGKVSLEEATAKMPGMNAERFSHMDSDKDGFLTREDRRPGGPGGEGGPGGRGDRVMRFMQADKDGDGKVTFEEATAERPGFPRENFDRMDSNHDGVVTKEDAPPPPPGGPGGERRGEMMRRIMAADADKDGKVSREEAKTGMPNLDDQAFSRLDRDGDGFIAPNDRPPNRPGEPPRGDTPPPPPAEGTPPPPPPPGTN